ncbi:succinate dehydrogenase, hydrophobic membrane anchor protein [Oleiagrimonas sp. C23AA]|uniref:succinate dehydrogenase, hydrophobic membrane anchor protein n=1 Tax=Oleiagrimonas sp. C23AA TaxID=2719047 RepID=UPI00141F2DBD|nr:succinate dehydrogenase, hydrophobic membrane anchor protein [Oleiagrimonas sp. C23AA]NII09639.1 succinate dehydrogenase, hydrophobic membrane anchor protein [Oleiagrimonas sp. C23AA]
MSENLRHPLKRVRGLGSAKEGVAHWWTQRVTAAALIVLAIWFVSMLLTLLHADFATAHAMLVKPWNAVLMIAFTTTMFWHAVLGLQVVIEDYVHTRWLEVVTLVLIRFLAVLFALACALAVLRVALGG